MFDSVHSNIDLSQLDNTCVWEHGGVSCFRIKPNHFEKHVIFEKHVTVIPSYITPMISAKF